MVSIILVISTIVSLLYLGSGLAPQNENGPLDSNYTRDYYCGVGLFGEGIYILATSQDPITLYGEFKGANDNWNMLSETVTTKATTKDFISILLSEGDKPTGGYDIQIENFAWLESCPVKFILQVNFTDPSEDVVVTQSLTSPLILVPIGKLSPGEYRIEVPITQFIFELDENVDPVSTQILKFAQSFGNKH